MVTAGEVRSLLDEHPELEPAVEAVLAADEPFTFNDIDIDSGAFGEVVNAGIAERRPEGYVITDRDAVERALANDVSQSRTEPSRGITLPTVERRIAAGFGVALGFVVLLRLLPWPTVFQDGVVVLSGNDPYSYRYWLEQLLLNPEMTLGTLPEGVKNGEPLFLVTLWIGSSLIGGTRAAAGQVMAWYPVVSAALTAVLLYILAVKTTDDRRVGLAAVILFAVIPAHAFRTSLGYADHHAFDYLFLTLTALSFALLVGTHIRSRQTALGVLGIGLGVGGQILAWDAGPLLLVPVGLTITCWSIVAVNQQESPVRRVGPAVGGVAVGAVLVWVVHSSLGWHSTLVAGAPLLVVLGGSAVVGTAELAYRFDISARVLTGVEVAVGLGSLGVVAIIFPDYWTRLTTSVTSRLIRDGTIAETQNIFGQSFGWLLLFGFVFILAIPYLAWATYRILQDSRWVPSVVYGWYFCFLAFTQVRFIGEFSSFAALFAGLGFVHLCSWVEAARSPAPFDSGTDGYAVSTPNRRQIGVVFVLFLLVGGLGLIQVPVKTSQIVTPEERYETAVWMDSYAAEQGWEYPQDYVFSHWSNNRLYNYFVSGESRSYAFARQRFEGFLGSTSSGEWYQRLSDRAGFIVYDTSIDVPPRSIGDQLDSYGSRTETAPGLAHYRAVYVSSGGQYRVFTLVPGATIVGQTDTATPVRVATSVNIDGTTFTYERRAETASNGTFRVTVPYPGEYTVGNQTATVSEQSVRDGQNVSV